MKMGILSWLYGTSGREKRERNGQEKEKRKQEKAKREKYEKMPDFKKLFASLPRIIKATIIPEEIEKQHVPSAQDRDAAKSAAEKKTKAAACKNKVDDFYARIETAMSKNLEIIWLLQTNEDVPFKTLGELIENYGNVKDNDSYRGMSVNYASKGKLYEISPLNEQDLDGLAKKLEC
jgi:hypothetical protein